MIRFVKHAALDSGRLKGLSLLLLLALAICLASLVSGGSGISATQASLRCWARGTRLPET